MSGVKIQIYRCKTCGREIWIAPNFESYSVEADKKLNKIRYYCKDCYHIFDSTNDVEKKGNPKCEDCGSDNTQDILKLEIDDLSCEKCRCQGFVPKSTLQADVGRVGQSTKFDEEKRIRMVCVRCGKDVYVTATKHKTSSGDKGQVLLDVYCKKCGALYDEFVDGSREGILGECKFCGSETLISALEIPDGTKTEYPCSECINSLPKEEKSNILEEVSKRYGIQ